MSTQDVGNFLIKYSMNRNLPPLIAAMVRPEFYPNGPYEVTLRQTHISYVFLAGGGRVQSQKSYPVSIRRLFDVRKASSFLCGRGATQPPARAADVPGHCSDLPNEKCLSPGRT